MAEVNETAEAKAPASAGIAGEAGADKPTDAASVRE